jgi:hypothetical protein
MSKQAKRLLMLVVVAVVLYFVISQPVAAADVVRTIFGLIVAALASIATFFRSLF